MRKTVRHILVLVLTALCAAGLFAALRASAARRHRTTCRGVEIAVMDSLKRHFVTEQDVRDYLAEDGKFIGVRIDSVDLVGIESMLDRRSAIHKSEAYITDDGILHVDITQREPVVRFQTDGNGFYADAQGFIFPLQRHFTSRVPVIDGAVPLKVGRGFKGEPADEAGRRWLAEAVRLVRTLERSKTWNGFFSQISVLPGGDLVLVPREGRERFIIGPARGLEAKLGRIRSYYEAVVPAGAPDRYGTVNVKYDKQIICKP